MTASGNSPELLLKSRYYGTTLSYISNFSLIFIIVFLSKEVFRDHQLLSPSSANYFPFLVPIDLIQTNIFSSWTIDLKLYFLTFVVKGPLPVGKMKWPTNQVFWILSHFSSNSENGESCLQLSPLAVLVLMSNKTQRIHRVPHFSI